MRAPWLAGLLFPAAFFAGCVSPPAAPDVQIVELPASDNRIIVNDGKALAEDQGERIIITGIRSALRTGNLDAYLQALTDISCPKGSPTRAGEAIGLTATPTLLQPSDPSQRKAGQLIFVAGYELSSTDPRFGGLSGLEVLDNGNLLAVSDAGHFVWIDLAKDGLTPSAARLATMRDAIGQPMSGLLVDSAEGLAVNGDTALVSFEGNHRILAFDIGKCGAAARGAPIVFDDYGLSLNDAYEEARIAVDAGNGSEPLAVTPDWFVFAGIERKVGHLNSLSARPIEAEPEFDLRVGVDAPEFAGMDVIPGAGGDGAVRAFLIHRSADAANGAVWVTETDLLRFNPRAEGQRPSRGEMETRARQRYAELSWRELAQLNQVGVTDAFEGIAAKKLSDGRVRLYLISDDDYADDKRTVLMIFDLAAATR
jgi:hypothetical protein